MMLMLLALLLAQANGLNVTTGCWIVFTIQCIVETFAIVGKIKE